MLHIQCHVTALALSVFGGMAWGPCVKVILSYHMSHGRQPCWWDASCIEHGRSCLPFKWSSIVLLIIFPYNTNNNYNNNYNNNNNCNKLNYFNNFIGWSRLSHHGIGLAFRLYFDFRLPTMCPLTPWNDLTYISGDSPWEGLVYFS